MGEVVWVGPLETGTLKYLPTERGEQMTQGDSEGYGMFTITAEEVTESVKGCKTIVLDVVLTSRMNKKIPGGTGTGTYLAIDDVRRKVSHWSIGQL